MIQQDLQAVPGDKAVKHDKGKLPYHLVPWDAMDEVVAVLDFGRNKYTERNWEQGGHWSRNFAACLRHLTQWFMGQDLDPESGLHHLAHAICCLFFALAFAIRKIGTDDRPHKMIEAQQQKPYCCKANAEGLGFVHTHPCTGE